MIQLKVTRLTLLILVLSGLISAQIPDSTLKKFNDKSLPDTLRTNVFIEMASHLINNNPNEAIKYCEQSRDLCIKIKYNRGLALAYGWLGYLYKITYQNQKAKDCVVDCIALAREMGDDGMIATSEQNLADILVEEGQVEKAIQLYFSALKVFEKQKDEVRIALLYNNISGLYRDQGQNEKAKDCLLKSLQIRIRFKNNIAIAESYGNLGSYYAEVEKNFPIAKDYYEKSLSLFTAAGDLRGVSYTLHNMASIYQSTGNFDEALKCLDRSIQIKEPMNDPAGIAASLLLKADIYLKKGMLEEGEKASLKGYNISEKIMVPELVAANALLLKKIFYKKNDYKNALKYFEIHKAMRDTLLSQNNRKAIYKAQINYEFDKKEAINNEKREKEKAIELLNSQQQKFIIWSICAGLLVVIGLTIFTYTRLRITKKQKQIIEKQKMLVEEQKKEILDSIQYARRIQQALLPTEKFISKHLDID